LSIFQEKAQLNKPHAINVQRGDIFFWKLSVLRTPNTDEGRSRVNHAFHLNTATKVGLCLFKSNNGCARDHLSLLEPDALRAASLLKRVSLMTHFC